MNSKKKVWAGLILTLVLVLSLSTNAFANSGYVDIVTTTQSGNTFWTQINYSNDVDLYGGSGGLLVAGDLGYCGYVAFPVTYPNQWITLDTSSCSPGYYDVYVTVPHHSGSYEDWKYNVYID